MILRQISLGVHSYAVAYFPCLTKKSFKNRDFGVFAVMLGQMSLGVHSYAVVHFPCLTKKSFKNRDFWVFAVTLGQISLGVHSYAIVHFPCLTKKFFKNRDFGSFRRCCDKYHSEYIRTPPLIFLVLRKNPSKIEILGLFGNTASNFARSTDSTPSFIFRQSD